MLTAGLLGFITINHGVRKARNTYRERKEARRLRVQKAQEKADARQKGKQEVKEKTGNKVAEKTCSKASEKSDNKAKASTFVPKLTAKSLEAAFTGDVYLVPVFSEPPKTKKGKVLPSKTGLLSQYPWDEKKLMKLYAGPQARKFLSFLDVDELYAVITKAIRNVERLSYPPELSARMIRPIFFTEKDLAYTRTGPVFAVHARGTPLYCCLFQKGSLLDDFSSFDTILKGSIRKEEVNGTLAMQEFSRTPRPLPACQVYSDPIIEFVDADEEEEEEYEASSLNSTKVDEDNDCLSLMTCDSIASISSRTSETCYSEDSICSCTSSCSCLSSEAGSDSGCEEERSLSGSPCEIVNVAVSASRKPKSTIQSAEVSSQLSARRSSRHGTRMSLLAVIE